MLAALMLPILAQAAPIEILDVVDGFGTLVVIAALVTIIMRGDLRPSREIDALASERIKEVSALQLALDRERALREEVEASKAAEVAAWQAAYTDQCAAREAAERSAMRALETSSLVGAMVDALRSAVEGRG